MLLTCSTTAARLCGKLYPARHERQGMQVVFLGGASHVGASCLAVAIGQSWILVDAGVRVDRAADRLPDLAFLADKPLVAIFVTHAHADHIGALPLVHQHFPHVPIYTSPATMQLI